MSDQAKLIVVLGVEIELSREFMKRNTR